MTKANSKSKFVAVFVAIALALSMVGITSASAFAEPITSGTIEPNVPEKITVAAGEQIDMNQYFDYEVDPTDGDYHIDFQITAGSEYASINKHSGLLTGMTQCDDDAVVVTAYLIPAERSGNSSSEPCGEWIDEASVNVTVTSGQSYGFQGGANAIMMISPVVQSFTGDMTNGYTNQLGTIETIGEGDTKYCEFTYQTASGFRNYDSADAYASLNAGNIYLTRNDKTTVIATLNSDNSGAVTIEKVDANNQEVTVKVDASAVNNGRGYLVFDKALRANNASNTLETNVAFRFEI